MSTRNAIVAFTFIFTLVTLLLQRAEGKSGAAFDVQAAAPLTRACVAACCCVAEGWLTAISHCCALVGPGQKALNALVQGLFVHLPIIIIRLSIPINEGGWPSFNAVFIAKNVVELFGCVYDFLEAGSQVKAGTHSYDQV